VCVVEQVFLRAPTWGNSANAWVRPNSWRPRMNDGPSRVLPSRPIVRSPFAALISQWLLTGLYSGLDDFATLVWARLVRPCIATSLWPPTTRRSCTCPFSIMEEEPEILVHISAPATRQKDELYRSLTDAYAHFEPCGVSPDGSPHIPREKSRIVSNVTTSKDSYGSFPSLMGSGNHSSSQSLQADAQGSNSLGEESQLPISRLDRLERIQVRWRQTKSRPSLISVPISSTGAPPSSSRARGAFIDDTQSAYQALESQILDNMSATSEDTSDDDPAVERTPLTESAGNSQKPPSTTASKAPLSSKACESLQAPTLVATPALEVYPPAPQVTIFSPGTIPSQITRFLATLKADNPNRYRPQKRVRTLDPDERGCWLADSCPWPYPVQAKFWTSLADHVGSGRLGWGVTLHREPAPTHELGIVRLYCWGEVAEHIWLALWICSDGYISGSGTQWVDAEERVVIETVET